jgi:hypothetical protein
VVRSRVPPGSIVLVVSKGDDALLQLQDRRGWHFLQREDGVYAGYHPANSTAAIAHLEELRARGAQYLLIPSTALWWLDYYQEFRQHLENRYREVFGQEDTCRIFALQIEGQNGQQPVMDLERLQYQHLVGQIREIVNCVLEEDARVLVVSRGDEELLKLGGRPAGHFPQTDIGGYAGNHPARSAAAIAHLEALLARGADYLLIPATAFWWLTYYRDFAQHLNDNYRAVVRQEHVCAIYALNQE